MPLPTARAPGVTTVAEAMVTGPATHPATTTVAEIRAFLDDPHRHLALVADGRQLLTTLTRHDLEAAPPTDAAVHHGRLTDRTVAPDCPLSVARAAMATRGDRRLAVVGPSGELLGLLCLKASGLGFCSDAGVAARAAAVHGIPAHQAS